MSSMNRLSTEKRRAVIASLVEGNSIRATVRMTGVARMTVTKLLVDMGTVCSVYMDRTMRDLTCERVPVRRDLGVRLRQAAERSAREARRGRRCLDLGCD